MIEEAQTGVGQMTSQDGSLKGTWMFLLLQPSLKQRLEEGGKAKYEESLSTEYTRAIERV